jgi:hypothetical protein
VIPIIAGLGFYYFRPGNEVASQNTEKTVVNESRPEIANNIKPVPVKPDVPSPTVAKFSSNTPKRQVAATPVVAKSRRIPANSELAVSNLKRLDTKVKTANRSHLPTLSNFEDSEDDSLRLADLLADVDTKNNN